ncbi:Hypothetical predicted protein [Paramuricea clavata]|uniref:Uncharacterized protein n=1 Tax=Paramuricea clavata TaxID=317549 RepID=A0A6S7IHD4_PARCT|nr:Hypothetical predicted protein [Paramuricea clavata]
MHQASSELPSGIEWNDKGTGSVEDRRMVHFGESMPRRATWHWGTLLQTTTWNRPMHSLPSMPASEKIWWVLGVLNSRYIWNDQGSGARLDGSVWQVDGPGLAGFFKVENGYQKPALPIFLLPAMLVQEK